MENKILIASTIGMGALGYVVGYSATKLSYKKNKEETLDK
jgi:hypothetical protein